MTTGEVRAMGKGSEGSGALIKGSKGSSARARGRLTEVGGIERAIG